MRTNGTSGRTRKLLAGLLVSAFVISSCFAQSSAAKTDPEPAVGQVPPVAVAQRSGNWHAREGAYYKRNWGIDVVGVHRVSSGYMLRFSYRIVDPELARPLNEQTAKAYLIDEATGARLAVPAMENIGELRQTGTPKSDRTYFIIFGNPGKLVKTGNVVAVVIGNLHLGGLVVD
jgi:hypothetical protein